MRALFICSRNRLRSPTAESIFAHWPNVDTDSAGLAPDADVPLTADQLEWAEVIFVMERSTAGACLSGLVRGCVASGSSAWISPTTTRSCSLSLSRCWSDVRARICDRERRSSQRFVGAMPWATC